jgi:urease accessory protein
MLELTARDPGAGPADACVTLDFEHRQRSRLRVTLDGAGEAAIRLPRGEVLRGGDRLRATDGTVVEVRSADEPLSQVESTDPFALARAAYHLGNRHVAVELGSGWVRYRHDHVLDHMVEGLGLTVTFIKGPFEPESGAYAGHHHGHSHDHDH